MLTPDELLHVAEGAEEIAEQLHQDILDRIVDRIMARLARGDDYILTAVDKWQIEVLQDAGYLLEDIQREIAKRTPYLQQEIAEAMAHAGVKAIDYDNAIYEAAGLSPKPLDQSPHLTRLMQRNYEATLGELVNFTRTTAEAAQQAYIRACDKAYNQVLSGSLGYTEAFREAINDMVTDGVIVRYPSGHTDTIETATLRAVRTGVSQASAEIQLARMDEMEFDLVLVSSHLGARPDHALWQGKVYSRNGGGGYSDFVTSTGYGTVTGLCGANCRHNFSPYFEGMDNPFKQYDSEENQKAYELQQRQRTLERRIRKAKRETMGLNEARKQPGGEALEEDYQRKAALLQKQNKAYNDFCEEHGLKKLNDRISIAKWDRQQAAQARAAARKHQKALENPQKSGKMKIDTGGRRNETPLTPEQISKAEQAARRQGYDGDIFYRDSSSTSFHAFQKVGDSGAFHYLVIGTDAYPNSNAKGAAVERISLDGCMAHEIVGHYEAWIRGTTQASIPLEEAQASIRASQFGVGLTDDERAILLEDGMNRLKDAGIEFDNVKNELDIWER